MKKLKEKSVVQNPSPLPTDLNYKSMLNSYLQPKSHEKPPPSAFFTLLRGFLLIVAIDLLTALLFIVQVFAIFYTERIVGFVCFLIEIHAELPGYALAMARLFAIIFFWGVLGHLWVWRKGVIKILEQELTHTLRQREKLNSKIEDDL